MLAALETLESLSTAAKSQLNEPTAKAAFKRWSIGLGRAAVPGERSSDFFASEAAFAAAARIALEARHGGSLGRAKQLFPHLYESGDFGWFRPDDSTVAKVRADLAAAPTEPLETLGWLYQFAIPVDVRKLFGQFYTGPSIVSSMLDSVGFTGAATLSGGRLIDPACGAGAYLIEATRRVIDAATNDGMTGIEICQVVQSTIHGLDKNPLGVLLTEAAIGFLLLPHLEDRDLDPLHLYVTDSIRADLDLFVEEHPNAAEIKGRTGQWVDGFAWVVANPPYAKYPSRLMTAAQKARFAKTTYGHPNLYGLFLQVGVELLGNGGRIGYINPRSFSSGLYFKNLRSFLTEELNFERFDTFDKRTGLFDGVLQDVVILVARRDRTQQETVELREFRGAPTGEPYRRVVAPVGSVLLDESLERAFFLTPDTTIHRVLDAMLANAEPLVQAGVDAITGTLVWNRVKPHIRDAAENGALPLIWANAVRPFQFGRLGNRRHKATHCALVDKTRNIVTRGPAILVKRLTAKEEARRIVACRMPAQFADSSDGYFAENHLNVVLRREGARLSLEAVLGLLNSRLYDFVFRALNGNTQVSATELRMLPMPPASVSLDAVEHAARAAEAAPNNSGALAALDTAVYDLFGIDVADRATIDKFYDAT